VKQFLRLPRREVLVIAGAAVLAFVITLAIMGAGAANRARRVRAEQREEMAHARKAPALTPEDLALAPEDFFLPDLRAPKQSFPYVPYRPRVQRWNAQMVRAYWIEPRQIAIDIIASINDQAMQRLFEKVP
jgi:hypothetical protein